VVGTTGAIAARVAVLLDHVEEPLPRVAHHGGVLLDDREVVLEIALPAQRGEALGCDVLANEVVDRGFLFSHDGIRFPHRHRTAEARGNGSASQIVPNGLQPEIGQNPVGSPLRPC